MKTTTHISCPRRPMQKTLKNMQTTNTNSFHGFCCIGLHLQANKTLHTVLTSDFLCLNCFNVHDTSVAYLSIQFLFSLSGSGPICVTLRSCTYFADICILKLHPVPLYLRIGYIVMRFSSSTKKASANFV